MTGGVTFGPLSFSAGLLTTMGAILAVLLVGNWIARARGVVAEGSLWIVIAAGLLAARAAHVIRFGAHYLENAESILDIRDGGFHLISGLCSGFLAAILLAWRRREQLRALLAGAGGGAAVFALAALVTLALPGPVVRLPEMTLQRLDGGTLAVSQLAGKPVVVNLWASWCGPCTREMPAMRAAQLAHPEATFIFVNQGETPAAVRAYLSRHAMVLDNVVLDNQPGMAAYLGSRALPSTFFFDRSGVLVGRRVGELSTATLSERMSAQK
jgi:thiol-disulfide isomerase/thioredoxin